MAVKMRAVVMLMILVGLPAAWVYYGPLPPRAQSVVDRVVELARDAIGWQQSSVAEATITAPRYNTDSYNTDIAEKPSLQPRAGVGRENLKSGGSPQEAGQFEPLLARLRELGVLQYRLEKWGNAGQMYRFYCAMPLSNSDEITRQFEAIAVTPRASIEQVVGEVSHWQTARLGP